MVVRRYNLLSHVGRRRVLDVLLAAARHTWAAFKCQVLGHRFPHPAGWCLRCEEVHNEGYRY